MKKINKDEFLEDMFTNHSDDFNKRIETFKAAYMDIKERYKEKINNITQGIDDESERNKLILEFIEMEKYRVENSKLAVESNVNSVSFSILIMMATILIGTIPDIYVKLGEYFTELEKIIKFCKVIAWIICGVSVIWFSIKVSVYEKNNYLKKSLIYDVAIKVLEELLVTYNKNSQKVLKRL